MYRLSKELAYELMKKIKNPEIIQSGEHIFEFASKNSIGILDPHVVVGSEFPYILESPLPLMYPDLAYKSNSIDGYFLYRRDELMVPLENWSILRILVDPTTTDHDEEIDVGECSVVLPNDIDKLVALTINTIEQLLTKEPQIMDCLNLEKNYGR